MNSLKALWPSVSFCIYSIQTAFLQLNCLEVCLGGFSSSCRVSVLHTASLVHPGERQNCKLYQASLHSLLYNPFTTQLVKAAQLTLTLFFYSRFLSIWTSGQVDKWPGPLGLYKWVVPGSSLPPCFSLYFFAVAPCSTLRLHFVCCQLVCLLSCMIRKRQEKKVCLFLLSDCLTLLG